MPPLSPLPTHSEGHPKPHDTCPACSACVPSPPQARPNSIAVFVPAEITTYAFYPGSRKQYMVANCIFRMGGAAIMLSNKKQYARTGK